MFEPKTDPGNIGPVSQKKRSECDKRHFRKRWQGQEQIGFGWNAADKFFKNNHCSTLGTILFTYSVYTH